jgi:hypothetical protein
MIRDPISLRSVAELWSRDYDGIPTNDDIYRDLLRSFWLGEFETADNTLLVYTDEDWSKEEEPELRQLYRVDGELEPVDSINWVGNPVTRAYLFHTLILADVSIPVIQEDRKNLLDFRWMKARENSENVFTLLSTVPPDRWPNRAHRYLRTIAISCRDFISWCEERGHEPPAVLGSRKHSDVETAGQGPKTILQIERDIELSSVAADSVANLDRHTPEKMQYSVDPAGLGEADLQLMELAVGIWNEAEFHTATKIQVAAEMKARGLATQSVNTLVARFRLPEGHPKYRGRYDV